MIPVSNESITGLRAGSSDAFYRMHSSTILSIFFYVHHFFYIPTLVQVRVSSPSVHGVLHEVNTARPFFTDSKGGKDQESEPVLR